MTGRGTPSGWMYVVVVPFPAEMDSLVWCSLGVHARCPVSGNLHTITYNSMLSSLAVSMALSSGHSGIIVVIILVQGGLYERSLCFIPALSPYPQVCDHIPGGEGAEPDGLPAQ